MEDFTFLKNIDDMRKDDPIRDSQALGLLDGRALATSLRADVLAKSVDFASRGLQPCLAIVLVGDDPSSEAYALSLEREGQRCGIRVLRSSLSGDASVPTLRGELERLGKDKAIHGVILQQPLPDHLAIEDVIDAIPIAKDVDGASPTSQGRLSGHLGTGFVPATPLAVMMLLEKSRAWPLRGRRVTVVGKSGVVGLPVSLLLLQQNATVTITHKETKDLARHLRDAEIVVTATGVPGLITGDMLAPGAVVIDVGTTFVDGVLKGDVDFESVRFVASELTPVPGGVGPVTNVALMHNVLLAAEQLQLP